MRRIIVTSQRRAHLLLRERLEAASPGLWSREEAAVRLRLVYALVQGVVTQIALRRQTPGPKLLAQVHAITAQLLTPPGAGART